MGNKKRAVKDGRFIQAPDLQSQSTLEPQRNAPSTTTSLRDLSLPVAESSQLKIQIEHGQPSSKTTQMAQSYQTPLIDPLQGIIPELQPIFSLLNDHANKLYQEGYFLKLDDQNTQGKPNADRVWIECFAQLVGTVLSLWDAAELDVAGQEGEVLPKFINLTDASIKMIESLPTRSNTEALLQNILSISTAGKNRYLLHFNSHHSLIQWTAGIRLAMYEHATLQEAYTGALIAGKGKSLNNINTIMERSKSTIADWVRVRFGAGTAWRRCWCVISPPADKDLIRHQKHWKKSPYDRSKPPSLKGDIKFYQSKKTKKVNPLASIPDAYSAFAIYPQSKPLIDASTLVKVEGSIIIHSNPPSTTEGFVFVMPEVHPGVTGFEMMLRWLFPVFDTFGLYGRPGRLVAATEDIRSLMFAMPTHRRNGYLETLDVAGLILERNSSSWKESYWRQRMKELTEKRMLAIESDTMSKSKIGNQKRARNSTAHGHSRGVKFDDDDDDDASVKSTTFTTSAPNSSFNELHSEHRVRTDSPPPKNKKSSSKNGKYHNRSASETLNLNLFQTLSTTSFLESGDDKKPSSTHTSNDSAFRQRSDLENTSGNFSSEDERLDDTTPVRELQDFKSNSSPEPVAVPPDFLHAPGSLPTSKPYHSSELRQANSRISTTTLNQMTDAGCTMQKFKGGQESSTSAETKLKKPDQVYGDRGEPLDSTKKTPFANNLDLSKDVSISNQSQESRGRTPRSYLSQASPMPHPPPQKELPLIPSNPIKRPGSSPPTNFSKNSTTQSNYKEVNHKRLSDIPQKSDVKILSLDKVGSESVPPGGYFVNQDVFHKISYESSFSSIETPQNHSDYEDVRGSKSPHCHLKTKSADVLRNLDKPRAGVMRTVGEINSEISQKFSDSLALDINFGPTFSYTSSKNLCLSDGFIGISSSNINPNKSVSHHDNLVRAPNERGSSLDLKDEDFEKSGRESRVLAWKPVLATGGSTGSQQKAITAEDFVAQRANKNSAYLHQRITSFDALRNLKTMPLNGNRMNETPSAATSLRNGSADLTKSRIHSRARSTDLLQRPTSRETSLYLGTPGHNRNLSSDKLSRMIHSPGNSIDLLPRSQAASLVLSSVSSSNSNCNLNMNGHLTAREQEHLSKVTGQPLISMATNGKNTLSAGLVAALDARERDKNAVKQGFSSRAVENIIQQRQRVLHQKPTCHLPFEFQVKSQDTNIGLNPKSSPTNSLFHSPFPTSNIFLQSGGCSTARPIGTMIPIHENSYTANSTTEYCLQGRQHAGENPRLA